MKLLALTFALVIGCLTTAAHSQEPPAPAAATTPETASTGDHWRLMMSPYTYHYHPSDEHKYVYMFGAEKQYAYGMVLGGSAFSNSFGQPSAYLYTGWRFKDFAVAEPLFLQFTAGLLYGYKPPYEDKVPFNHNGFSPGAVMSVGWQFTKQYSAQLNFLGNAALMFQFSVDLPP